MWLSPCADRVPVVWSDCWNLFFDLLVISPLLWLQYSTDLFAVGERINESQLNHPTFPAARQSSTSLSPAVQCAHLAAIQSQLQIQSQVRHYYLFTKARCASPSIWCLSCGYTVELLSTKVLFFLFLFSQTIESLTQRLHDVEKERRSQKCQIQILQGNQSATLVFKLLLGHCINNTSSLMFFFLFFLRQIHHRPDSICGIVWFAQMFCCNFQLLVDAIHLQFIKFSSYIL